MKTFLISMLFWAASCIPLSAITIWSPVNGTQVTSPFRVAASTKNCGGLPVTAMGYSLDDGPASIEPASFSVLASASSGLHVLHVKCWGQKVHDETLISITVVASSSDIRIITPSNGASLASPIKLAASSTTCNSVPAQSMGYSLDSSPAVITSTSFSASITASTGSHILHVKCWGRQTHDEVLLNVNVMAQTAVPVFWPVPGTYVGDQVISLTSATPGSVIYYTTDGSSPSTASLRYSGAFSVSAPQSIRALAIAPGYLSSGLVRADYVIKPKGPPIPSNAIQVADIQQMAGWRIKHDPATAGTSDGYMALVSDPAVDGGQSARFITNFSDSGGELYSITYGTDANPKNFVYDAEVWIEEGSSIANLEMDNNQVIPNGDTVIYAFQCSGHSNTWEYSSNAGTPVAPIVKWIPSDQPCSLASWTKNAWHHVQISYSRDDLGNVTYHSVWVDSVEAPINKTVNSDFSLKWTPGILVANFQVDGNGNGSATLYLDQLSVYRW